MSKNTTIRHKRSSVSGNVPDSDQIDVGELAINFPDQTLYTKDGEGQIIELGSVHDSALTQGQIDSAISSALPDGNSGSTLHYDGDGWVPNDNILIPTNARTQLRFQPAGAVLTMDSATVEFSSLNVTRFAHPTYGAQVELEGQLGDPSRLTTVEVRAQDYQDLSGNDIFTTTIDSDYVNARVDVEVNPWVATPTGIEYTAGFAEVSESPTKAHHIVNKVHLDGTQIVPPNGEGISSIDWNGNSTTLTSDWPLLISVDGTTFGNTVDIEQGQTLYMMWAGTPGSGEGIDSPHGTVLEGEIKSSEGKVWYYEFTVQKEVTFVVHSSVDSNQELGGYSVSETYEVSGVNSYVYPSGSTTGDSAQYELITDAGTRANGYLDLPDSEGSSPQFNYMVAGDKFRLRHRNSNSTDTASIYNFSMAGDSANWTTVTAGTVPVPVTPSFVAPNALTPSFDMEGMIRSTPFKMSDGSTSGHVSTDWEITKVNTTFSTDSQVLAKQRYAFYHPNFGYHVFGSLMNSDGDPAHRRSTDGQTWTEATGKPWVYTRSYAAAAANDTTMVVVGATTAGPPNTNDIYYSNDGVSFTRVPESDIAGGIVENNVVNRPWHQSVIWNGTNFFIFCNQRGIHGDEGAAYILLYSSDGITWNDGSAGVVAGSVEPESLVMNTQTSTDQYENQVSPGVEIGPIWTGTKIVAIFNGYEVMSSPDGFTWTSEHVFDHIIVALNDYGGDRTINPPPYVKLGGFKYYDAETGYVYVDRQDYFAADGAHITSATLRAHIDDLSTWTEVECTVVGRKSKIPSRIVYDSEQELYIGLQQGSLYYCESSDLREWFGGNGHKPAGNQLTAENTHIAVTKTPLGYLCTINNIVPNNGFNRSKHYVPVGYVNFDSEDRIADTTNLTTYEPPFDANEYRFMKVRYNTATESSLWSDAVGFTTSGAQGWYREPLEGHLYEPTFNGAQGGIPPQGGYVTNTQGAIDQIPQIDPIQCRYTNTGYGAQSETAMHYGSATGAYGFGVQCKFNDLQVPSYLGKTIEFLNLYLQDRGEGNDEPASRWWCATTWVEELRGPGSPFDQSVYETSYDDLRGSLIEFVHSSNTGEYAILTLCGYDDGSTRSTFGWGVVAFESPHNGDLRMYPTAHVKESDFTNVVPTWYSAGQRSPKPNKLIRDFSTEYNQLTIAVGDRCTLAHITLESKNDGTTSPTITLQSGLHDLFGDDYHAHDGFHDGTQFVVFLKNKSGTSANADLIRVATSTDGLTWTDRTAALYSEFSTVTWPDSTLSDLAGVEPLEYDDVEQLWKSAKISYNGNEIRVLTLNGIMFTSTDGAVTWTRDTSLYDRIQQFTKRDRPGTVASIVWHETYDTSDNTRNGYWVVNVLDDRVVTLKGGIIKSFSMTQTPGNDWKSAPVFMTHSVGNGSPSDIRNPLKISNNEVLIGFKLMSDNDAPNGYFHVNEKSSNSPYLPEEE